MVLAALNSLFVPQTANAELQKIEATGIYTVGGGADESPKMAKERAKREAMRIAVEKAGVYVESYSEMKNYRVTKDEIISIAGEVVNVENETYQIKALNQDVLQYTAIIVAVVDSDVIAKKLQDMESSNKALSEEYDAMRLENERLAREYERLQKEKSDPQTNFDAKKAQEYLSKGNELLSENKYAAAAREYSHAIEEFPQYADAYYGRAKACEGMGDYENALSDYTSLIALTNESADAYFLRGAVYEKMGNYDAALEDYGRSLARAPQDKRAKRARERLLKSLGRTGT